MSNQFEDRFIDVKCPVAVILIIRNINQTLSAKEQKQLVILTGYGILTRYGTNKPKDMSIHTNT